MEAEGTQSGPERIEREEFLTPSRRGFLRAAALGVGATAVGWSPLRPMTVLAHDVSGLNCTANDVQLIGSGQVVNEPCQCSGTFPAEVQFTVRNNSASERRCVTLHLCPIELPDGTVFDPGDVVLPGSIPGKTTQVMTATSPGFPCGAGLLCFGEFLPGQDNADVKGLRCPDGKCCSTVSWTVRPNEACGPDANVIPSKCRHQQICIQGRGVVTLDCDPTINGPDCAIECGTSAVLRACIGSGTGPFTFKLLVNGNPVASHTGAAGVLCHDFTVTPSATTIYTATVTDSGGCTRASGTVTVTVRTITPVINITGGGSCGDGLVVVSTTVAGSSGCSFQYTIDGSAAANSETAAKVVRLNTPENGKMTVRFLDGQCHIIGVTATCGGCSGTATKTLSQCVSTTLGCTPAS